MLVMKLLGSDWKLQRWNGCAATITESSGESMYGCLWELDIEHLKTLDNQEGVHQWLYERIKVEIRMNANNTFQLVLPYEVQVIKSGIHCRVQLNVGGVHIPGAGQEDA